jgi:uncharacterized protein
MAGERQRSAPSPAATRLAPAECVAASPSGTAAPAVAGETVTEANDQESVIAFLSDPASYGAREPVERIETHCSIVFLVGKRAYKLKRAISYASLDYTTLELRRAACVAELRLNRRSAPGLYLGVHSVARDESGRLAFDGQGHVLDYVVVMRRFAQEDLFDHMAEAGRLTPKLMRRLGMVVADLHRIAERTPQHGGVEAIRRAMRENDHELSKVSGTLDGPAVGALGFQTRAWLDRVASLLEARRKGDKVRHCHGDLRLANICLYRGQPTLFDCIEFSDEVGCIDVLHDLAFLLMDLLLSGGRQLANAVFNSYLDQSPETEGLRALPLFLALRAATRSYALAGSAARRADPREAAHRLAFARRHIEAGLRFLSPPPPSLILLGGADRQLRARTAGAVAGMVLPVPGARILHWDAAPEETWTLSAALLSAGCAVLIEGSFADEDQELRALDVAGHLGERMQGFWIGPQLRHLDPRLWQVLCPGSANVARNIIRLRLAHLSGGDV